MGGIDAIIFDMDGTLLHLGTDENQMEEVRQRLTQFFKRYGIDEVFKPVLEKILKSLSKLKEKGYSPKELKKIKSLAYGIIDEHEKPAARNAKARMNAVEIIRNLKQDYQLALVTSNGRKCAEVALRAIGLSKKDFSILISRDDIHLTKPHPMPLIAALDRLRLSNPNPTILFIGDHIYDMICGKAAQEQCRGLTVITIGINGGRCNETDLRKCHKMDFLIQNLSDIETIPERIECRYYG